MNLPGLKAGASSRFTLSGACYPFLKGGASRRRTGQRDDITGNDNPTLAIDKTIPKSLSLLDKGQSLAKIACQPVSVEPDWPFPKEIPEKSVSKELKKEDATGQGKKEKDKNCFPGLSSHRGTPFPLDWFNPWAAGGQAAVPGVKFLQFLDSP